MNILIQNINDKNLIIIFPEIEKNIKEFLTNNLYNFKPIIILKNFLILFISICQKNQIKQFEFLISKFLSKCNNFFINNYVIGKDSLIDYLKLLQIIFSFEKNYLNNETKIFDDIFNFINKIIYEFDPKINNEIVITLTIFTNEIILKNKINVKNYYLKSLQIIIYLIINPFYSNVSFTTKVEIFEKLIKAYNNFGENYFDNNKTNKDFIIEKIFGCFSQNLNELKYYNIHNFSKNLFEQIVSNKKEYIDYLKNFLQDLNCYKINNIENIIIKNINDIKIFKLNFIPNLKPLYDNIFL